MTTPSGDLLCFLPRPVEKTSLPERSSPPKVVDASPTEHAAKFFFGVGALFMMGLGIAANNPLVSGCGAMMAGVLVFSRVIADLRNGVSSSNWGAWHRKDNRIGFRCNVGFWGVVALLWFVVGSLIMLNLLRVSSW